MNLKQLEKNIDKLTLEELESFYYTLDDYETQPVSIEEFITNPIYLGNSFPPNKNLPNEVGFYPYWLDVLKEIYPSTVYSPYYIIFLRGCLAGETLISTLNGHIRIDEMCKRFKAGEEFWVLSYNINTKKYEPEKVSNAFTTGVKELYEITLDNGKTIKCTANHRFLTRDKKWKSIETGLKENDSLYPYEYIENEGKNKYHKFYDVESEKWEYRYRLVAKWKIGQLVKGFHIHHKNYDRYDDRPTNLCILPGEAHSSFHARKGGEQWKKFNAKCTIEYWQELGRKRARLFWDATDNLEVKEVRAEKLKQHMLNGQARDMGLKAADKYPGKLNPGRDSLIEYNKSEKGRAESVNRAAHMRELLANKTDEEKYVVKLKQGLGNLKRFHGVDSEAVKERIELIRSLDPNYNHYIVSIKKIEPELVFDLTTEKNHNFVLSSGVISHNSIGRGKTTTANIIMAYEIYKLLCLKNPQSKLGVIPSTRIVFALMNITLSLSTSVVWDQLNQYFSESTYFTSIIDLNRKLKGKDTLFPKRIDITIGSRIQHGLGQAVFGAMLDEAGFDILNDQVVKNFQSLITRMQSRFMEAGGIVPGKLIVISSESEKGSSLTKLAEIYKGKPGVFVDTGPLWDIRPWMYSGETFRVFVGSDSKEPEIITTDNEQYYTADTADVIEVPIEHKDQFDADIYSNIRDLAGRATTATYKFIRSRDKLTKALIVTPIFEDVVRLDFDDINDKIINKIKVADYFINPIKPKSPRYVHIDIGLTGDRLGIACGSIIDYIEYQSRNNVTLENKFESFPKIQIEWCIGIEPTPGKQIPLFKIREFLFTLHELGYHIGKITLDGFECFTGDTKISLLNGTEVQIKDLQAQSEFWVYSCDENGNVVPGRGHNCRKTGDKAPILKVTLDNGEVIRCTYSHKFLMRDGQYKEAISLKEQDSLMPLYRQSEEFGYENHYNPATNSWRCTHTSIAKCKYPEYKASRHDDSDGHKIHHLDYNKRNNEPGNLELCYGQSDHMKRFHSNTPGSGWVYIWGNEAATEKRKKDCSLEMKERWKDPVYKKHMTEMLRITTINSWTEERRAKFGAESRERNISGRSNRTGTGKYRFLNKEEVIVKYTELKSIKDVASFYNVPRPVIGELLRDVDLIDNTQRNNTKCINHIRWHVKRNIIKDNCPFCQKHNNHKVIKVEDGGFEDVYDIEVDIYHNFALSSGVFVHNSADFIQIMKTHNYNCELTSVDRTLTPYIQTRDAIYQHRLLMPNSKVLGREFSELEMDNKKNKVDHPDKNIDGSKGCFTEDTKIALTDGTNISFKNLIEDIKTKDFYTYTINLNNKSIQSKKIVKCWISKQVNELLEITLDNGKTIRCTDNHLFMNREGSYVAAKDLNENDSLMPLYTKLSSKGLEDYRLVYNPMLNKWHYEHRQFMSNMKIPKGYVVHHIDYDKHNNNFNNLKVLSVSDHIAIHNLSTIDYEKVSKSLKRYWLLLDRNSEEYIEHIVKISDVIRNKEDSRPFKIRTLIYRLKQYLKLKIRIAKRLKRSIDRNNRFNLKLISKRKRLISTLNSRMYKLDKSILNTKRSDTLKKKHLENPEIWSNSRRALQEYNLSTEGHSLHSKCMKNALETIKKRKETIPGYKENLSKNYSTAQKEIRYFKFVEIIDKIELLNKSINEIEKEYTAIFKSIPSNKRRILSSFKEDYFKRYLIENEIEFKINHKITKIVLIKLDSPINVYDIEVEDNHNFALTAGVFVHNSKDISDAVSGVVFNLNKDAARFKSISELIQDAPGVSVGVKSVFGWK